MGTRIDIPRNTPARANSPSVSTSSAVFHAPVSTGPSRRSTRMDRMLASTTPTNTLELTYFASRKTRMSGCLCLHRIDLSRKCVTKVVAIECVRRIVNRHSESAIATTLEKIQKCVPIHARVQLHNQFRRVRRENPLHPFQDVQLHSLNVDLDSVDQPPVAGNSRPKPVQLRNQYRFGGPCGRSESHYHAAAGLELSQLQEFRRAQSQGHYGNLR